MLEQKLSSKQKDETQLPSSPNNSNTFCCLLCCQTMRTKIKWQFVEQPTDLSNDLPSPIVSKRKPVVKTFFSSKDKPLELLPTKSVALGQTKVHQKKI